MTEQTLRHALEKANSKGQAGLFIWHSKKLWDVLSDELKPGKEYYQKTLSKIRRGKEVHFNVIFFGLRTPGVVAVSVKKLLSSEKNFKKFLKENISMEGPIVFISSNEVIKQ